MHRDHRILSHTALKPSQEGVSMCPKVKRQSPDTFTSVVGASALMHSIPPKSTDLEPFPES